VAEVMKSQTQDEVMRKRKREKEKEGEREKEKEGRREIEFFVVVFV